MLLVAACTGSRCAALRRLDSANPASPPDRDTHSTDHNREPDAHPDSEAVLRAAIRRRHDAILVSVPCLGPCHRGSLTAIGAGVAGPHDQMLTWLGRPTLLARTELPRRARALADWITGSAPDPATLPEPFLTDGAHT